MSTRPYVSPGRSPSFSRPDVPPARLQLARTPTPLERLERLSQRLGVEILIKRDDLTGMLLSGNKVRKLEYLLADAMREEADTVITCGGEQSNHARATACAAARLGLRAVLALRTADPRRPPPARGNILLDHLVGAEIHWISRADYGRRGDVMERLAEQEGMRGRKAYVIPEGGSNALGALGYVHCVEELVEQLDALGPRKPTTVIYACGSGGTGAGLILGQRLLGAPLRLVGFAVCDDRDYFVGRIIEIACAAAALAKATINISRDAVEIDDRYVGAGYAKSRPDELRLLRALALEEGIVVDPVYTGKAFFGMMSELAANRSVYGERIVFLHTGGLFGLFGQADELLPLLPERPAWL